MAAITLDSRRIDRSSGKLRRPAAFLTGLIIIGGAAIDAFAADAEPAKKIDPLLEEDRVHKLSIFSYMQPLKRGQDSVPVLVTLNIKGPKGLRTFCEFRPRIFEDVLRIVTDDQVVTGGRQAVLEDMKVQMLEAVNHSLPDAPVSSIDAKAGRSASEFGKEIVQTNGICKKLDG